MRTVVNLLLFLVVVLMMVGVYMLRDQGFNPFQRTSSSSADNSNSAKREAPVVKKSQKPRHASSAAAHVPDVNISVSAVPLEPKPVKENDIQVGMDKSAVWQDRGQPAVMASSRDRDRWLETYIYLDTPSKATVVRVVDGLVASVRKTGTNNPPLLVPRQIDVQATATADAK